MPLYAEVVVNPHSNGGFLIDLRAALTIALDGMRCENKPCAVAWRNVLHAFLVMENSPQAHSGSDGS